MPENINYNVIKCEVNNGEDFVLELRVKYFLSEFNTSSGWTFNTQSGRPDKYQQGGKARSRYRGYRKCCLNVTHSEDKENQQAWKNTKCEAAINKCQCHYY